MLRRNPTAPETLVIKSTFFVLRIAAACDFPGRAVFDAKRTWYRF